MLTAGQTCDGFWRTRFCQVTVLVKKLSAS